MLLTMQKLPSFKYINNACLNEAYSHTDLWSVLIKGYTKILMQLISTVKLKP